MTDTAHLLVALRVAVPLEIAQMAALAPAARIDRARHGADALQAGADVMQFGSADMGQQRAGAASFAALACALAAMAYQPGGVTFSGVHWCTNHRLCLDAAAAVSDCDPVLPAAAPKRLVETPALGRSARGLL